MSKEMVISATPHETRVAILEEGQLCEIYVEREKEFALVGSIYKGRVTRVLPGMQSAFVDIGLDSDAFLYVSDFLENLEEYDTAVSPVETKVEKMEQEGGDVFSPDASRAAAFEPPDVASDAATPAAGPEEVAPAFEAREPSAATPLHPQGDAPAYETRGSAPAAPPPARSEGLPGEVRSGGRGEYTMSPRNDRGGFGKDRGGQGGGRGRFGRGDRGRGGFGRDRGRGGSGQDRGRAPGGRELPPSKFASHRPYEPPSQDERPPVGDAPFEERIILPGESLAKYRDRAPSAGAPVRTETHVQPDAPNPVFTVAAPSAESEAPRTEPEATFSSRPIAEAPEPADASREESFQAPELFVRPAPQGAAERGQSAMATGAIPAEAERHEDPHLSDEEATALAEQVAEAQREEAEAEAAAEAAAAEETGETSESEGPEQADSEEADDEQIRREIFDAAGDIAEQEQALAEAARAGEAQPDPGQERPYQARVQDQRRQRFQRPMRRGGRGHRSGPQHGGRPHQHRPQQQREPRRPQLISEMLKAGQEIIVQIAKEPMGRKGARITSHVALPGRFLVYMPTVEHIGVSRKIGSADERARLRRTLHEMKGSFPGGFIVRTAASGATEEELRADVNFLGNTWQEIRTRGEQRKAPAILHRDLNLVERILRDHMSRDYTSIWIDGEEEYSKVVEFVNRFQPSLVNRVKLFTKPAPIFEEFGIQQEIDKSLRPKVWLKSGGYIVINHTEALVAIDVNTGKFVGKGSTRLEDTIVKTNVEAVKEIVRQIRLRDLGGIIVVDFIDMEERKNRARVMQALDEALRDDKAPSKVLPFNEFGLVAITRKRTKQALERVLCQPCPYCTGSGMVKSLPTLCYEIQAEARKMAKDLDTGSLTLRVNPEIAKALKTRESGLIEELEQWTRKHVIIQGDPTLHWEQYDIY